MTDALGSLFLFGPGYSATVLANIWPGTVFGTVRNPNRRSVLEAAGIVPVAIDDRDALLTACAESAVLVSTPPDQTGCPALAHIGDVIETARHVTYLSTTGVYGDLEGGWAMDWTPVQPGSERGRRRVAAEAGWRTKRADLCCVRLPGIYGSGRSVFDRIEAGSARRIVKAGQVFSRIHVDDLASGLFALIAGQFSGNFNLCDDFAAPPQDVVSYAYMLLGQAPPPEIAFDTADLSPMARSFYSECKRVSNAKLKAATGWRPRFVSYVQGLDDIHARRDELA